MLLLRYAMEDLKTAQEKRRRAFKDLLEESSICQVFREYFCNANQSPQDAETDERDLEKGKSYCPEEEDKKILKYNDDLEELNKFGIFKYVVYPIKMSFKYVKEKFSCCKKRQTTYQVTSTASN